MSEIQNNISEAIFKINTSSGSGTGFYLKSKGVIVTNCHVILGFKEVAIENQRQDRFLGKVVFVNQDMDIAFVKPEKEFNVTELVLADISNLQSRDKVFVLGFPFGMPYTETNGIVSAPRQLMQGNYYIQTDAAVNPGNSGGPVTNENGEIVGITTCKFTEADNMGFAIPVDVLRTELESFQQNTSLEYAVKCHSCKTLIYNETEYCPNCGNTIDAELFKEVEPTEVEKFVEKAITQLGINPVLARLGYEYWEFHQGSALLRIFVYDKNYLTATSPLNNLPTTDLERFYRYLLSNPVAPYQLGICQNQVYISYRVHLSEIFSDAADDIMKNYTQMLKKADELDDFLEKEYNCSKSNFARAV